MPPPSASTPAQHTHSQREVVCVCVFFSLSLFFILYCCVSSSYIFSLSLYFHIYTKRPRLTVIVLCARSKIYASFMQIPFFRIILTKCFFCEIRFCIISDDDASLYVARMLIANAISSAEEHKIVNLASPFFARRPKSHSAV